METTELEDTGASNFLDCYLGEIRYFGGDFAPRGWHFCDGTLLEVTGNEALYSLLGTNYGGDGRVNFGLPDFRGRIPVGVGSSHKSGTKYSIGQKGGSETITLVPDNMPEHAHGSNIAIDANVVFGAQEIPADKVKPELGCFLAASDVPGKPNYRALGYSDISNLNLLTRTIQESVADKSSVNGMSLPQENLMPSLCINMIIAISGYFPSQPHMAQTE